MANRFVLNETSYHGKGAIKEIATEIKARGFKKAFVCSDPDLIKFNVTKKVTDVLDEAKISYEVFSDIKPNPTIENVQNGPMTTIGGYIDGILDGTIPENKQRYYMQIVSDETKRLSRLVRSMLDISQLQGEGGIPADKLSRFDAEECVGQMLITFEQKIMKKDIYVEVEMPDYPVYTIANRDYISQVIYNLLDNAVKFCPDGGTLWVTVQEGDNKLYISIANQGPTIPPEELSLLFDRFHKIDKSRSENRDGWGLGLYIVKTIIGLHGEDISVTSIDGKTEFTFTLPLEN